MNKNYAMLLANAINETLREYQNAVYHLENGNMLLAVTDRNIEYDDALSLIGIRQRLSSKNRKNDPILAFSGAVLPFSSADQGTYERAVYYGSCGERITNRYLLSSLKKMELFDSATLLLGKDVRSKMKRPSEKDLISEAEGLIKRIEKGSINQDVSEIRNQLGRYIKCLENGQGIYEEEKKNKIKNALYEKINLLGKNRYE